MNTFSNIKELIAALKREEKLLSEMFTKRKALTYKYEYALEMVDFDDAKIQYLIDRSVIRKNNNYLEIDNVFLHFFEQVLSVNEEINISYINDNIQSIKENIDYYLEENNENRKYNYLRTTKNTFRKIGIITLRNVIDLRRNIETTFKNEPNYKIKKSKLENLDNKRKAIVELIKQTENLIYNEEHTFFKTAIDEELKRVIVELKQRLDESTHNLIEIEKQIINYLNQIKYQSGFIEQLRKVKYLKDQFTIKAETNIESLLNSKHTIIFEPNPITSLKLSLDYLTSDENAFESIKKISKRVNIKANLKPLIADIISNEYLETEIEEEISIDLEEVKNNFIATSNNLFEFVINYDFLKEVSFNERVTIYCQMVSQYEMLLNITNDYKCNNEIEFAVIYPK